jgi:hypothetical protein
MGEFVQVSYWFVLTGAVIGLQLEAESESAGRNIADCLLFWRSKSTTMLLL